MKIVIWTSLLILCLGAIGLGIYLGGGVEAFKSYFIVVLVVAGIMGFFTLIGPKLSP